MKKNCLLAGAFGLIAAVVYFCSMATYAFPGESAHLMAVWKGLVSDDVVRYPLMAAFAKAFGCGNVIAPVCGIIAVVAFFCLVSAFLSWRVGELDNADELGSVPPVAAIVATTVFLFSPAVRQAATHLEPRMFDFTWLLLCLALSLPFFRGPAGLSYLFAPLLGAMVALGACDSVLFLVFTPVFLVLVVMMSIRHKCLPIASLFLFVIAFLGVLPIAANVLGSGFVATLARAAREFSAYRSVPGWVFVLLFATVPFILLVVASGRAFRKDQNVLVPWIFHGAMSFVVILAVATPLSPSALMEPYGILPVATSAFAAAVAGYLVAYWWAKRRQVVGIVLGGVLAFVLSVSCVWNLFDFDRDAGDFADKIARRIVSELGSRRWLVTDGTLDDHLHLVAAEEGKDIHFLSLARDLDERYLEEIAEIVQRENVGGAKNDTLKLSLSLGVLPFIQDWFAADPTVDKEVAIFGAPDLWYAAGKTSVPELLFFGGDESANPDWTSWKELDAILWAPKGWGSYHDRKVSNPVDRLRFNLRRHIGFVANNRGVYLQDKKRDDEAFAMYELVLNEIDRDNICAIFNEVAMVGQDHAQAKRKQKDLERMLKAAVEDKGRRYLLWRLGTYYGYIRNPDTFIRLGHAWARSGRPGDALSQIRRAIDFVPSDKRSVLLKMMATLYANENEQATSRKIYKALLSKNANDHDALVGMMRLELVDGNGAKALDYLERAAKTSGEGRRAKLEHAMVAMMKNDSAQAKSIVQKLVDADMDDMQAWSLLASVIMQQIDASKDEKEKAALLKELEGDIIPAMEKRAENQFDYYLQTTKGFLLLRKGAEQRKAARDSFAAAAKSRPDIAVAQDMVLGLDISLDDKECAEAHAKDVLRKNRKAPLANYVMGSLALGRGKYAEAESYLRVAAEAPQPVAMALNDLAEVLRRNKNYAEAETYARKATEKAPGLYVAWETLGSVLMDAGAGLDEAEACIRKACELSKDKSGREADIRMLVSLARVQIRRGDMQHAKVTVRKVRSRVGELSEFERDEFEAVAKGVR